MDIPRRIRNKSTEKEETVFTIKIVAQTSRKSCSVEIRLLWITIESAILEEHRKGRISHEGYFKILRDFRRNSMEY
jgi:hypothetical protein